MGASDLASLCHLGVVRIPAEVVLKADMIRY